MTPRRNPDAPETDCEQAGHDCQPAIVEIEDGWPVWECNECGAR